MWNSIQNGPYMRLMIPDPNGAKNINGTMKQILEPLSKMIEGNKKQYIANGKVMNYFLQAIPNDIYNSVDACKNAKEMWKRIKRLMFGFDVTSHVRHLRLMDEFDKFTAKEGEFVTSTPRFSMFLQPEIEQYVSPWFVTIKLRRQFLMICWELQGDSQEDKLTTAMMLLARAITQKFSTPTNNCLRTSSNIRNQAVVPDGRVDIQTKNTDYNGHGHYARDCRKPRVRDANYFIEQMLLAMKYEAGSILNDEENDFMVDNSYGEETMEEIIVAVMLMAQIQPVDGNAETVPSYDAKAVSEVNVSSKVHEQVSHVKCKTIIQTSDDDQIDSNIIFDDPYVENNGGTSEHDSNAHDEYHEIQMLAYNVQREAENKKQLNNGQVRKGASDDIVDLEEKLSCNDRIVYKMGQSIPTIHMLGKKPNKVYDPFLKAGLGYPASQMSSRRAIAQHKQKKMYDGERLHSAKFTIDSPDLEETLEDPEESVESSNSVRRPKSNDTKSKDRVLKNNNDKRPSSHVRKMSSSVIQLVLWIVDSGCLKHMTGNLQLLCNFVEKFIGTVHFGNDHFAAITGYGDYVQGNLTICHVYYVEGLGHNLFSVRQFYDGDLEVAFCLNTCYVQNLEGDDLLTGARDSNLYTTSISEMATSSLVCLMSRATSTKSWLWHRRLSHLNFGTINQLTSKDLVDGLLKFKYNKDHLCSAYEQGKSKKASLPPKLVPSTESKLELFHMDLYGPMRIASINGKKYFSDR
ncbi:retrovirus-related pol polyprotein from transposon TNT 1-94 [Tanacetum coccineum]